MASTNRMARAVAVSQLTSALLSPEHGPIVDVLAKRGFPRPRLEALATASRELADKLGGKTSIETSRHTQLEADAVAAQHELRKACRRMIAIVDARQKAANAVPPAPELSG